jgi:hypothetical protein
MKTNTLLISGTLLGLAAFAASAAVLSTVPMQGAMVHVGIAYNAAAGELQAHKDPITPVLVPLDVSNPADSFNPADPWFGDLDPSQQGLAFNRQYGFVMDGTSDPLPANASVWIRFVSASAGLRACTYRASPATWSPMFGTDGSSPVLEWSLMMFHPAFTVPPVEGLHSASFEAFLVNLTTGQAVPGVAPAEFVLDWISVATSRPALAIANDVTDVVVISWTTSASNYMLQSAETALPHMWTAVTNEPELLNGHTAVVLEPTGKAKLFRLIKNP